MTYKSILSLRKICIKITFILTRLSIHSTYILTLIKRQFMYLKKAKKALA